MANGVCADSAVLARICVALVAAGVSVVGVVSHRDQRVRALAEEAPYPVDAFSAVLARVWFAVIGSRDVTRVAGGRADFGEYKARLGKRTTVLFHESRTGIAVVQREIYALHTPRTYEFKLCFCYNSKNRTSKTPKVKRTRL